MTFARHKIEPLKRVQLSRNHMRLKPFTSTIRSSGFGLLLALMTALALFRLGAVPLVGPDEPRYSRVAVEMHRSGDWITPTLQGEPWLEKPILFYWIAAIAMTPFGESELAVRLPSALSLILLVAATAFVGRKLFGKTAGLHAGFALATGLLANVYGRAASMDMLLAAPVTAAIGLALLRVNGDVGRAGIVGAYVCAGFACLAKGPLGLLLPLLVSGAYLVTLSGPTRRESLARLWSPLGALAFMIVTLPWYAAVVAAQGEKFIRVFLVDHNIQRFTSEIHRHPGAFYYYLPILLLGLFPWSGWIVPAIADCRCRQNLNERFVMLWIVVPLVFFSAAGSKLPGYILPCLPPFALLIGRAIATKAAENHRSRWSVHAGIVLQIVIGVVIAALPLALLRHDQLALRDLTPFSIAVALLTLAFAITAPISRSTTALVTRTGGVAILITLFIAAPSILDRSESGRNVFRAARGENVLSWGAPRSIWMSGYFYNDGRVREVFLERDVLSVVRPEGTLVLCGLEQRRRLSLLRAICETHFVAAGPRNSVLYRINRH